jgi:hypothetical protein
LSKSGTFDSFFQALAACRRTAGLISNAKHWLDTR